MTPEMIGQEQESTQEYGATEEEMESQVQELRTHAQAVGRDVQRLASTAGEAALERLHPIEQYVRDKPLQSLLMAAGIGALACLILRR